MARRKKKPEAVGDAPVPEDPTWPRHGSEGAGEEVLPGVDVVGGVLMAKPPRKRKSLREKDT